jgi:hypothetical protein
MCVVSCVVDKLSFDASSVVVVDLFDPLLETEKGVEHRLRLGGAAIKKTMRSPGIEPGPPAWQARILPLDQLRLFKKPL